MWIFMKFGDYEPEENLSNFESDPDHIVDIV